MNAEGYARVRLNGQIQRTDEEIELTATRSMISMFNDWLDPREDKSRLVEAIEKP